MPNPEKGNPTVEVSLNRELKDKGEMVICACRGTLIDLVSCKLKVQAMEESVARQAAEGGKTKRNATSEESTHVVQSDEAIYLRQMALCNVAGREEMKAISKANRNGK